MRQKIIMLYMMVHMFNCKEQNKEKKLPNQPPKNIKPNIEIAIVKMVIPFLLAVK